MHRPLVLLLALAGPAALAAQSSAPGFSVNDLSLLKSVSDPQLSPDGLWVAYTVGTVDVKGDQHVSDLYMTSWDGQGTIRLTSTPKKTEHTPRWSPDGRYLAFLSGRDNPDESDQLWLLSRRGGEAEQVTSIKSGIQDYVWSPDGSRIVLVIEDGDSVETSSIFPSPRVEVTSLNGEIDSVAAKDSDTIAGTAPPIVIDRFYFKADYTGYLRQKRTHLYLYDVALRSLTQLTQGRTDEFLPNWSPDGQYIVFSSKRGGKDPDRTDNWDLYVIQAAANTVARQLTSFTGPDNHPDWNSRPQWSPDGRYIAYLQGGADSLLYYPGPRLAVVPWGGQGPVRVLTETLDRPVYGVQWSADGKNLYFRFEDDRQQQLGRIPLAGGTIERLITGPRVVTDYSMSRDGRVAVLVETSDRAAEIFASEGKDLRPLSRQNDSLFAARRAVKAEEISVKSKDGTVVNGFLFKPLDYQAGTKYPTILALHGGPVSQFDHSFDLYWQTLAARGYAVVAMNPRGSSGRGDKYALAIWADWGNKDVQDVLAGVDYAVKTGVADSARLGVGGWSYGGMLTNYVIASTTRFKAATSGAGISNILAGYGTDMYVREYEYELGTPWKNTAAWLKVSYPFLHADRIKTPTLFMCGEKDFNVPMQNSQQMYQALRSLGVDSKLVLYPDQWHGIDTPSYQRHRYDQWLAWFDHYLNTDGHR